MQDSTRHQCHVHFRTFVYARIHEHHTNYSSRLVGGNQHPFTGFDVRTPRAIPFTAIEQLDGCVRFSLDSGMWHELENNSP